MRLLSTFLDGGLFSDFLASLYQIQPATHEKQSAQKMLLENCENFNVRDLTWLNNLQHAVSPGLHPQSVESQMIPIQMHFSTDNLLHKELCFKKKNKAVHRE